MKRESVANIGAHFKNPWGGIVVNIVTFLSMAAPPYKVATSTIIERAMRGRGLLLQSVHKY